MNSIITLFLIIGIIFIATGYIKTHQQCAPPTVEFRYVPKTFEEEQDTPVPILSMFNKMFADTSPWEKAVGYDDNFYHRSILDPKFREYGEQANVVKDIPNSRFL